MLKKPNLIGYRPDHILHTVRETARIFECPPGDVIGIALRHPAILIGRRESFAAKIPLVLELCHALGFRYTAADTLRECPLAYTYATERLQQRLRLAVHGRGPRSIMNLLTLAQNDADRYLRSMR